MQSQTRTPSERQATEPLASSSMHCARDAGHPSARPSSYGRCRTGSALSRSSWTRRQTACCASHMLAQLTSRQARSGHVGKAAGCAIDRQGRCMT